MMMGSFALIPRTLQSDIRKIPMKTAKYPLGNIINAKKSTKVSGSIERDKYSKKCKRQIDFVRDINKYHHIHMSRGKFAPTLQAEVTDKENIADDKKESIVKPFEYHDKGMHETINEINEESVQEIECTEKSALSETEKAKFEGHSTDPKEENKTTAVQSIEIEKPRVDSFDSTYKVTGAVAESLPFLEGVRPKVGNYSVIEIIEPTEINMQLTINQIGKYYFDNSVSQVDAFYNKKYLFQTNKKEQSYKEMVLPIEPQEPKKIISSAIGPIPLAESKDESSSALLPEILPIFPESAQECNCTSFCGDYKLKPQSVDSEPNIDVDYMKKPHCLPPLAPSPQLYPTPPRPLPLPGCPKRPKPSNKSEPKKCPCDKFTKENRPIATQAINSGIRCLPTKYEIGFRPEKRSKIL